MESQGENTNAHGWGGLGQTIYYCGRINKAQIVEAVKEQWKSLELHDTSYSSLSLDKWKLQSMPCLVVVKLWWNNKRESYDETI